MTGHFFIPAIVAAQTGPVVLAVIFLSIYFQQRKPFLGLWMLFWMTFLARCLIGLSNLIHGQEPSPFLVDHLPNIAGGIVLLWGTRLFMGRRMPLSWIVGFILAAAWLLLGVAVGLPQRILVIPSFAFLSAVYFRTGIDLLRWKELQGSGKYLAGTAFILWALIKAVYLVYFPTQKPFNPWGYVLCLLVANTLAVGLLLSYFESLHRQLADSEDRYRSLVANIPDITWTRNRQGVTVYMSPGIERFAGAGHGIATAWPDTVHPDEKAMVEKAWDALFDENRPYDVEYRIQSPGGNWVWVHDRALKTYRRNGAEYSDGLLSNIDKRKETERILRRYERIVSTSEDLMFMLDANLDCLVANRAFAQACGRQREHMVGRSIDVLLRDADFRAELRTRLSRCLQGHPVRWRARARLWAGGQRILNISAYPYREKEGAIAGIVVNAQDITETRELEKRLDRARRLEAISVLAGGVAHRFNNELAVIQGRIDLVRYCLGDASEIREHIAPIAESVRKMAGLTRKLLAYGGGGNYQLVHLDLNEFLRTNLPALTRDIAEGIAVETRLGLPMPHIVADPAQLRLVFSELISNAVEALGDTGKVLIETLGELTSAYRRRHHPDTPEGACVGIVIADDGRGMDAETTERIFEPFFSTRFAGRGLSMAAVHGIIKSLGGDIVVESEPGRGTTVRICLPVGQKAAAARPAATATTAGDRKTLLLVEDEPELITTGREILQHLRYRVLTAATGAEALRVFSRHLAEIDLVLLDMKLPDMDGRQVFHQLARRKPDVRVIICTGYALNRNIEEMLASGAAGFLQKPFRVETLAEALHKAL